MLSTRWFVRSLLCRPDASALARKFGNTACIKTSEAEFDIARQWLKTFDESVIPKSVGDVSYSRSSGPGGQNVNKVNSKAQLRVSLERLLPIIPAVLHDTLRSSRYYAKDDTLLIQSDESRKQSTNRDTCWTKLCLEISRAGSEIVPGETPEAQREKVKGLQRRENEARLRAKKLHAGKKVSRSNSRNDL